MRIAVTGASGFVGRNLLAELARADINAVPISRQPMAAPAWRASPMLDCDVDPASWANALRGIDAVVHCAARVHVMREQVADPIDAFRRVNRDGAIAMARGAAMAGVRRIVFLSTVKVLGDSTAPGVPLRNADPIAPTDAYAVSKAEAECALAALSRDLGFELVVLRPPLVYGPGVGGNVAALLRLIRRGIWLPLGAAGTNRRSLVSTANLSAAIIAALTAPAAVGRRLLVSDGDDVSTRALLEELAVATGRRARLVNVPAPTMHLMLRALGREAIWTRLFGDLTVDIEDTCTSLDWRPRHGLADGLRAVTTGTYSHD